MQGHPKAQSSHGLSQSTDSPGFMERLRVLGQVLGCWDPAVYRGTVEYTESLVHGWTLGYWDPTKRRAATKHRCARSLPVHGQTQGCVRQLQVQGLAVRCWDSPVQNGHGMY